MGDLVITDKVFPEWKLTSQFINQHLTRALSLDAKLSSHPIEVECPDASRVYQVCLLPISILSNLSPRLRSSIVCRTRRLRLVCLAPFGGHAPTDLRAVLRMLATHVGEDKFLRGVSLYLKYHLFGSSVTEDLWKGITTATGLSLDFWMFGASLSISHSR